MFRSSGKLMALTAIALLALAPNLLRAAPAGNIFDSLMMDQKPKTQISLPNPPEGLRAMLESMIAVQKVELRTYTIKEGMKGDDLLKVFKAVLKAGGWQERVLKSPGRAYDAVYSKDGLGDSTEFLLIELEPREVTFFRVTGSKSKDPGPVSSSSRKKVPSTISLLRISAYGPSLQYEAWTQELVEIKKIQPTGGFTLPDILTEGTSFHVTFPGQPQQEMRPLGALDYAIRGPQHLSVAIESTGSPLTVTLDGAKALTINTANARVTITGAFAGGNHRINVVNQKIVLNLSSVKQGEMKVTATNADITVTLPQNSDVLLTATAVAGTVTVKIPDEPAKTENPFKQTFGQGTAMLTLDAISGKIVVNFKK